MGHVHLIVRDLQASKQSWSKLLVTAPVSRATLEGASIARYVCLVPAGRAGGRNGWIDNPGLRGAGTRPASGAGARRSCRILLPEHFPPFNLGSGPGRFMVNLRLSKAFGFGERTSPAVQDAGQAPHGPPMAGAHGGHGGPGGPATGNRYSFTFSISARNLLNTVNLAPPVGNLSSPLFGESVALGGYGHQGSVSANRTVELQVRFSF